jgi:nucleoside 2-deoxyribosyltransferase
MGHEIDYEDWNGKKGSFLLRSHGIDHGNWNDEKGQIVTTGEFDTEYVKRPLVYVAGPYAHPDPVENTHRTIHFADDLQAESIVTVYIPHLSMLWHALVPHDSDYWYAYDLAILARCDALLRIPGESSGADNEIAFAKSLGIPVFYAREDLYAWVQSRSEV